MTGSRVDCDDLVAEAFARSWRALAAGEIRDPGAYLRRVIVNEVARRRRWRVWFRCAMEGFAAESFPARPCAHYVFVDNVGAVYERAAAAGSSSLREPSDRFYGNREAGVVDPWGNVWWIATVIEAVDDTEIQRRWQAARGRAPS